MTAEVLNGIADQDPGGHRLRRAAATSASALLARGASFLSLLLLVPLAVPYLGTERYGIWMTLVSLASLLGIANLGIGNALVTLVARANAVKGDEEVSRYISTAVGLFAIIAASFGLIGAAVISFLPWSRIFNVSSTAIAAEGGRAAIALFAIFLLSMPIGIISQIRLGYQEGYVTAWFDAAASVLGLGGVAAAIALGMGLPSLVAAILLAPVATGIVNWALLLRRRPALLPSVRSVDVGHIQSLLRSSGLYFTLQLAIIVGFSSDNFVAAQVLGPAAVTAYAVPSRLALAGVSLLSTFSTPLWPAYADALARGDVAWVLRVLRRSLLATGSIAFVGAAVLIAFGSKIVDVWSRGNVHPHASLLVGLGLWVVLGSVGSALAMFLNAAHVVRMQVVCASLMAVVNIFLSIVLARRIGVAGLIWGTVISYTLLVVVPYAFLVPRFAMRLRDRSELGGTAAR